MHGTRPVNVKNKTVTFTVIDDGNSLEKIFIVFVSMEFGSIKNTSAGHRSTRVCFCRLLHLKLFDHVVDFFLGRGHEVVKHLKIV